MTLKPLWIQSKDEMTIGTAPQITFTTAFCNWHLDQSLLERCADEFQGRLNGIPWNCI
jgi:hypothetical protein